MDKEKNVVQNDASILHPLTMTIFFAIEKVNGDHKVSTSGILGSISTFTMLAIKIQTMIQRGKWQSLCAPMQRVAQRLAFTR